MAYLGWSTARTTPRTLSSYPLKPAHAMFLKPFPVLSAPICRPMGIRIFVILPWLSLPPICGGARAAWLRPNPPTRLFALEAHQQSFPKRPFRSALRLSCRPASQREPDEVHECWPGYVGIVRLLSFVWI